MNDLEEGLGKKIIADVLINTGNIYFGVLLSLYALIRDSAVIVLGWASIVYLNEFDNLWGFSFGVLNVAVALLLCGAALKASSPILGVKSYDKNVAVLRLAFSGEFGTALPITYYETKGFINNVLWPILTVLGFYVLLLLVFDTFLKVSASTFFYNIFAVLMFSFLVFIVRTGIKKFLINDLKVESDMLVKIPYISSILLTISLLASPSLVTIPLCLFFTIKLMKDTAKLNNVRFNIPQTSVNSTSTNHTYTIWQAVSFGDEKRVHSIIESGVNINKLDPMGQTVVDIAKKNGHIEIEKLLRLNGGKSATEL